MTEKEKKAIIDFVTNRINKIEFLTTIELTEQQIEGFIYSSLERGYNQKDSDDIEYALYVGYDIINSEKFVKILSQLIIEDWHISHENIAMILQRIKSPDSVDSLVNAINLANQLKYLDYNEGSSFIRKCSWALGDINTDYSNQKLKSLSFSDNPIIKEFASHQLERKK